KPAENDTIREGSLTLSLPVWLFGCTGQHHLMPEWTGTGARAEGEESEQTPPIDTDLATDERGAIMSTGEWMRVVCKQMGPLDGGGLFGRIEINVRAPSTEHKVHRAKSSPVTHKHVPM